LERAQIAFVAIDAGEGFRAQDATIASLAQERGCATVILANKWDLVEKDGPDRAKEVREKIQRGLRFLADAPLCQVSAKTGAGVGRLLERAQRLQRTAERRIPTAELNRWLQDCARRHEPAMAQRGHRKRPLKFFYATQTNVRPPTFVLVCTDPSSVQPSYRRFLENRLRESFDFDGIPIRLRLRPRSRKDDRE
jgi:GTP-binding protein